MSQLMLLKQLLALLQHGQHYWFTSKDKFEAGIQEGKFLEHARVHQHIYGTSFKAVEDVAAAGKCCVLDIDVQGARQVKLLRSTGPELTCHTVKEQDQICPLDRMHAGKFDPACPARSIPHPVHPCLLSYIQSIHDCNVHNPAVTPSRQVG